MNDRPRAPVFELRQLCEKIFVGLAMAVTPHVMDHGVKLIRNQNIRPNRFDPAPLIYLNEEFAKSQESKRLMRGDVIAVRTGANIGDACVVPDEFEGALTFTTLIARPRADKLESRYLAQYVNSSYGRKEVERLMAGGGKGNLNSGELEKLRIVVPTLNEQVQIADVCEIWDIAIANTEQLIAAKERHYTHELSRFISQAQHPQHHISEFAREVSERNRDGVCERVLSVTNDRGFVLPEHQFERRVASEDLSNYKVVRKGQYAYNPSRINVGSIARLDDYDMGVLSPMYAVFAIDEAKVNSDFFKHWLDSHEARERIKRSAQGSVRETVSFSEFAHIRFPLPLLEQQQKIANYLNTLREEIALLAAYAGKLKEQKRGLMQKLLNGQWRLKVSEGAEVA